MCCFCRPTSQSTSKATMESSSGPSTVNEVTLFAVNVTPYHFATNQATINAVTKSCTPTEFHLFPNLPAEIRLKIWNWSILQTPRMVKVHVAASPIQDVCDRVKTLYGGKDNRACCYRYHEYVPTPAIPIHLQICFESRLEALKHYQRGLTSKAEPMNALYTQSTQCRHEEETYKTNQPFYFSPEVDVIFITSSAEWHDSPELTPVSPFDKLSDIWVRGARFIQARIVCMAERYFTELYRRRELPQGYQGIEYILLLWGEDWGANHPRLGDIYPFFPRSFEENLPWEKEKLFLEMQYTEAMHDFRQNGLFHRKITVKIGDTMKELLEKAREIGPGRSKRNYRNPLSTYEAAR
jgi:hypothetical protein